MGSKLDMAEGRFRQIVPRFSRSGRLALHRAFRSPRVPVLATLLLAWVAIAAARSGEVPAAAAPDPSVVAVGPLTLEALPADAETFTESTPAVFPEPALLIADGELGARSTLANVLGARGFSAQTVALIAREMAPHFDFRRARPNHRFWVATTADGSLVEFRYYVSETSSYRMERRGSGFEVSREEAVFDARNARMSGVVESTLYAAILTEGEGSQLARDFAEVFAWDIDFQRSVRAGDRFELLYERLYRPEADGNSTFIRTGRVLAARYEGTVGAHTAVYFEPKEGRGGYYRPDGSSVERQFLMAPLRHARISSAFNPARKHPILKVVRPHSGIDYAAPQGTPVWSVADGVVIHRGRSGGFGNLVKIRHANGYVSYYAHLSRYPKGLQVGTRVEQKQVIGYVGSTGLSTGPHVCFRIARDGRYVNPARLRTPAGDPVAPDLLPAFQDTVATLLSELEGGTRLASESAL